MEKTGHFFQAGRAGERRADLQRDALLPPSGQRNGKGRSLQGKSLCDGTKCQVGGRPAAHAHRDDHRYFYEDESPPEGPSGPAPRVLPASYICRD